MEKSVEQQLRELNERQARLEREKRQKDSAGEDFAISAAIGAVTDSALLGGLLGGDLIGGMLGDLLNGGDL